MPRKTTRLRLACFDGEYEFQIGIKGCVAIEEKTGGRIGAIYGQVLRGRFMTEGGETFGAASEGDFGATALLEIVRQGLIGGGKGYSDGKEFPVSALKANMLIATYLDPSSGNNLTEAWNIAAAVMHALVEGVDAPDEQPAPDAQDNQIATPELPGQDAAEA